MRGGLPRTLIKQAGKARAKVNSADRLYLVIESVRPDTKHRRASTVPVPGDGAGGSDMR